MDAREFKGMQIAATMPVRRSTHGWLVPSQAGHGDYTVSPVIKALVDCGAAHEFTCTCPDYELRGLPCKHVFAVEMTVRREYNSCWRSSNLAIDDHANARSVITETRG